MNDEGLVCEALPCEGSPKGELVEGMKDERKRNFVFSFAPFVVNIPPAFNQRQAMGSPGLRAGQFR